MRLFVSLVSLVLVSAAASSQAAVVFDLNQDGSGTDGVIDDGSRWTAAPLTLNRAGSTWERSLDGGLRYSAEGGSWAGYRNQFNWQTTPSVADFQDAAERAFAAWTVVDPVSGFGTQLAFVEDFSTPVSTVLNNFVRLGAEIDLLADDIGSGQRGISYFNSVGGGVTLTSGTTGYGGFAIAGADVTMNTNVVWSSLSDFEVILTHEIGHAIGLGDVDFPGSNGFIDNNYNAADPLGTLTDSWADLVNPLNPGDSPGLTIYTVPNNASGVDRFGVDILMESNIPQVFFDLGEASLANDDFSGRQFLYPETHPAGGRLVGDYNHDGQVNAADYTVWRDALSLDFPGTDADGNRDGQIGSADYAVWQNAYGDSLATLSVPEPTALGLLGLIGLTAIIPRSTCSTRSNASAPR